ncbi:hypothetical protein [Aeromicrobium terrae]|uniref:ABM domain-containing protein n=1 Tax=Aeromicrobium terrae TaxID=2498846 RepID=A0A5C8NND1_9ACTN|nr:hypothetical protein [Aeromicrobium terrae]TXL61963.1 hypothetical protein FHP06_04410 [Aeromicrobium terrae]
MHGLTVRWSLAGAAPDVLDELRAYVEDVSFANFAGLDGLRFKSWRARPGEWFEGSYAFATAEAREAFQTRFEAGAAESPGSRIIGSAPVTIEACEIVAVVEGPESFRASATFER